MRLRGCAAVRLCGCAVVRLCGCATVQLCGCVACAAVRLCGCAVVQLCCCVACAVVWPVRLCGCAVVCQSIINAVCFSLQFVVLSGTLGRMQKPSYCSHDEAIDLTRYCNCSIVRALWLKFSFYSISFFLSNS